MAQKHIRTSRKPVRDRYIVIFDDEKVTRADIPAVAREMATSHGAKIVHQYSNVLPGFAVLIGQDGANRLLKDPRVSAVEEDGNFWVTSQQVNPPSWGLDRIDQDPLPLDGVYNYFYGGANTRIYVVDTGVNPHQDFGTRLVGARNFVSDASGNVNPNDTADCYGHG
ncbi:MAG TPA: protease inhibitor I9 family protein, partial [Thermoanaerobaculia bacterium]|nr:protease inhibitor I9 family protein [Thermoanaerobaculia bacterium]